MGDGEAPHDAVHSFALLGLEAFGVVEVFLLVVFDAALGRAGFRAEARNTVSWNDRIWQQTNHNLDRIVTRDGIAYGIEIKNTQSVS
ncbi:MAG TPA: hypothetical protein VIT23_17285 [Terrimicrobiaceae bacterium]